MRVSRKSSTCSTVHINPGRYLRRKYFIVILFLSVLFFVTLSIVAYEILII